MRRDEDETGGEAGAEGERKRDKSKGKGAGGAGTGDEMEVEEEAEKRSKSKKRKREEVEMEEEEEDEEPCEDEADEDGGGWDNCVINYTEEIGRLHGIYKQFKVGGGCAVGCVAMVMWCGEKFALDTDTLASWRLSCSSRRRTHPRSSISSDSLKKSRQRMQQKSLGTHVCRRPVSFLCYYS